MDEEAPGKQAPGEPGTSLSVSPFHRTFTGSFSAETLVSGGCFASCDPFQSGTRSGFTMVSHGNDSGPGGQGS